MREVTIALLGCGTVGTEVARLLSEQGDVLSARAGARLRLIGIAVRSLDTPRDPAIDPALFTTDAASLISQADIVIELMGGIEPARSYALAAFDAGASVVTGNKALLAQYGPELYDAAARNNVDLYFEAAVAGAVPVVYGLRESLAGDSITAVLGIVNGTTNYILDEMTTKGLSFDAALAQAQALGYAEADPTADVDGYDAAAKAAILASLAFHTRVSLDDVAVEGIRSITAEDIRSAERSGYVIKLIATARKSEINGHKGIEVRVNPALVPLAHPLASIRGSYNAVFIEAEAAGRLLFSGRGAGGRPTASAVLSDVVAAAAHRVVGGQAPREVIFGDLPFLTPAEMMSRYSVAIDVSDEIGVLSRVAAVLASNGVSMASVRQEGSAGEGIAKLCLTTHITSQANMDATVAALAAADCVHAVRSVMRVEDLPHER